MKGFEKVTAISREAQRVGAKFISLADDNTAILSNPKDGAIWEVPYGESEGAIMFNGAEAKKVRNAEPTKADEFNRNTMRLRRAIGSIFTGKYDESIVKLKNIITKLPYVDDAPQVGGNPNAQSAAVNQPPKAVPPQTPGKPGNQAPKVGDPCPNCNSKMIADGQGGVKCGNPNCGKAAGATPATNPGVAQGMNKQVQAAEEIMMSSSLFLADGSTNNFAVSSSTLKKAYSEANAEVKKFLVEAKKWNVFSEAVKKAVGEKAALAIFENMDFTADINQTAAKAITVAKVGGHNINAVEAVKVIIKAADGLYSEEQTAAQAAPFVYNFSHADTSKPTYLKFRTGAFTYEAVKTISSELDKAMASKDLTAEELTQLGDYRVKVEYMLQSKQICDKVLEDVIKDFNKSFLKTDQDYDSSPLGWRNRQEQEQGWVKGYARQMTGEEKK